MYYKEIGNHFGCSSENIRKILKKHKYTIKKNEQSTKRGIKTRKYSLKNKSVN
jgi:uncharacterized protein YjcR